MRTVEEIEKAIETLPRDQFYQLREWVQSRFEDEWDRQIEQGSLSGRVGQLAQEALADHRTGLTTPFPPDEKRGDASFLEEFPRSPERYSGNGYPT